MKKIKLTLALMLALFGAQIALNAQTTKPFILEDFNGLAVPAIPAGWTTTSNGFRTYTFGGRLNDSQRLCFSADQWVSNGTLNTCFVEMGDAPVLQFYNRMVNRVGYPGAATPANQIRWSVSVTKDYGVTWETIKSVELGEHVPSAAYELIDIDVSDFANETCMFRIYVAGVGSGFDYRADFDEFKIGTIPAIGSFIYEDFNTGAVGTLPKGWTAVQFGKRAGNGLNGTNRLNANVWNATPDGWVQTSFVAMGANPGFSFYYRVLQTPGYPASASPAEAFTFGVQITKDFGTTWEDLEIINPGTHIPSVEYVLKTIDVSAYANETCMVRIFFNLDRVNYLHINNQVDIEDFKLGTQLANDIAAVYVTGNTDITVGTPNNYNVEVRNKGLNPQSNYTVKLMKNDGIQIATLPGTEINSLETFQYTFLWSPEVVETVHLYGEVVMAGDEDATNNKTDNYNVNVRQITASSSVAFGTIYNNAPVAYTRECSITNHGTTPVEVNVLSASSALSISGIPLTIAPGATETVTVTINNLSLNAGSFTGNIVFGSDIATHPEIRVNVTASVSVANIQPFILEDFNGLNVPAIPAGWTTTSNGFRTFTFGGRLDDSQRLCLSADQWVPNGTLNTCFVEMGNEPVLQFYNRMVNRVGYPAVPTPAAQVRWSVSVTKNYGTTWEVLKAVEPGQHVPSTDYELINIDVSDYVNEICMFRIYVAGVGSFDYRADFDEFKIGTPPVYPTFEGASTLAFGTIYNAPQAIYTREYNISNTGTGNMTVDLVSSSNAVIVSGLPITVAPGTTETILVTLNQSGLSTGSYSGNFVVSTNDPDKETVTVSVTASVLAANIQPFILQDFNALAVPAIPAGWTTTANGFRTYTFGGRLNDSQRLCFSADQWVANGTLNTCFVEMGNEPVLQFYNRMMNRVGYPSAATPANQIRWSVSITKNYGLTWEILKSVEPGEHIPSTSYELIDIDVSNYANEICLIRIYVAGVGSGFDFRADFDEFKVGTFILGNDLAAVSISGNANVIINTQNNYTVEVQNKGSETQTDYTVKLMKEGGTEIASLPGVEIEFDETIPFVFAWTPEVAEVANVYGKVVLAGDENESNNESNNHTVNVRQITATATVAFGSVLNNVPVVYTRECSITNHGTTAVEVNVLSSSSALSVSGVPLAIAPGATETVTVTIDNSSLNTGAFTGNIVFGSDVANHPEIRVNVTASVSAACVQPFILEDFNALAVPAIPAGWTTTANGFRTYTFGGRLNDSQRLNFGPFAPWVLNGTLNTCYVEMGDDPVLQFYNRMVNRVGYPAVPTPASQIRWNISVTKDYGATWEIIKAVEPEEHIPSAEYELIDIDVSDYANEICMFRIYVTGVGSGFDYYADFDEFKIGTFILDNDLAAVSISGNANPAVGFVEYYTVEVKNKGSETQTDYVVKLMKEGDIQIAYLQGVEIEQDETIPFVFEWTPAMAETTYLYGEVVLIGDEKPENNKTENLPIEVINVVFTLTLQSSPTEGGTTTGEGEYIQGSVVPITATPNEGYQFVNWTREGVVISSFSSISYTVNEDVTLVANFEHVVVYYTVEVVATIGGTVEIIGHEGTTAQIEAVELVTIKATPNTDYKFVDWSDANGLVSANAEYTFTVTKNVTLTANFIELGIKDNILSQIVLYPNPFTNEIYISAPDLVKSVQITDILGQTIKNVVFNGKSILTAALSSGIYFVTLESFTGDKLIQKVVKK